LHENQEFVKRLSIRETAELLGMGVSTLTKKLQSFPIKGIVKEDRKIWIPLSSIPELKKVLKYNNVFDKGTYYSTTEVAKKFNENGLKIKRSDINNWLGKGKVKTILHLGYRYIHEKDLDPFINEIKDARAIPAGYCTLEEAGNILGMFPDTIRKWAVNGDIESIRVIVNDYWQTLVKKEFLQEVKKQKRIKMLKNFDHVDITSIAENIKKNSNTKKHKPVHIDSLDGFLEVKDAANLLGIKKNSLWTLLRNGNFPLAIKIQNKWYIPEEEILSYQEKRKIRQRCSPKIINKNSSVDGYCLAISEISKRINLSKSRITALIYQDLFPNAKKVNGIWYVPEEDLNYYYEYKKNKTQGRKRQVKTSEPKKIIPPQGYLTTKEVAKKLGISVSAVSALANKEKFNNAKKIGKNWIISESNVIEYIKQKEKNQISITKPDMISELKQFINSFQGIEHIKETTKLFNDFFITKLNATNGRINNVRRVFTHLKKLFSDIIINLEIEIYELQSKKIESVMKNRSYSNPIRELFLKFLKEACLIKGKKLNKEYVLLRGGKKTNEDIDTERYSPEVYYLYEQHVKDIEKHISPAIERRQYANMWVLTTMLLTNAWRPSDIIFEMPHIDIEVINVLEFDWFKTNRLSTEQCQLIVNQLYLKLNNAEVSKTNADLHFLVAPDMVKSLAYACVISELHCRLLQRDDSLFEKEHLLLGTFVSGVAENPNTSGTMTHKKFFEGKPKLIPFSSKKLHNSTMTYLFLDISEDEEESELALEVVQWTRSHKDINVTAGYIKLTNKDGNLDRVSINLFKRGHFGWLYNYMVQVAFSNTGIHQTFEERTKTIAELKKEYSPIQLEAWAQTLLDYKNRKESVVKKLYKMAPDLLKELILKIYKGQMPARDGCGQCLSFPDCHFGNRKTCIGCINFIPQLQQVLLEAKKEFYRLIDSMKSFHTDAILKRDTVFLFNVLLLFNEAAETFGNDTVNGFLPSEERMIAIYSIADKLKLPTVNA
jgi:predicted DNA-binding transcriptional regulator AlpA